MKKGLRYATATYGTLSQNGYGDRTFTQTRTRDFAMPTRSVVYQQNMGSLRIEKRLAFRNSHTWYLEPKCLRRPLSRSNEVAQLCQLKLRPGDPKPSMEQRLLFRSCRGSQSGFSKKLAAPEGFPGRSPTPVLTGPCGG